MEIYVAGPLFTQAERQFNESLARSLRGLGQTVNLPQEMSDEIYGQEDWQQVIFDLNVEKLKDSDIVLAILDGPIVDDGTAFEIGMAYQLGKPIVGLRTDFREAGPEGKVNLMIEKSVDMCFSVKEALDNICQRDGRDGRETADQA